MYKICIQHKLLKRYTTKSLSLYWFVDLESNNRHLHTYFLICVKVLGLNRFFIDLHKQELEFWIWSGVSASFHGDHEVIEGTPIRQDWQLILYSVCLQCSYSTSYCICAYKHTYKKKHVFTGKSFNKNTFICKLYFFI